MIWSLQTTAIAAAAVALGAFGLGMKFGADGEARKCTGQIEKVRAAAETVINAKLQEILTLTAERDQAHAEVQKVNETTAKQFAELQVLLSADQVKREEASARVEAAARQAASDARKAAERSLAAKEVIDNAPDKCVHAGIPDDVRRVLNDALGAP